MKIRADLTLVVVSQKITRGFFSRIIIITVLHPLSVYRADHRDNIVLTLA